METDQQEVLFSQTYPDLPLTDPPIARVIGQVRFGSLSVLQSGGQAAQSFIAALAERYPYSEQGVGSSLQLTIGSDNSIQQAPLGYLWRMFSADRRTSVALTDGSLTFETTHYQGREAFRAELSLLTAALTTIVRVPAFSRLGVRYTNRLRGLEAHPLQDMINPRLLGVVGATVGGPAQVVHSLTQALFSFEPAKEKLLAQWGVLPAGTSIDPTLAPIDERSWLLDLDAFVDLDDSLAAEEVGEVASACAERAYTFFRWAVTDSYLREFGASL